MRSEIICRFNKFGYCKFGERCFRKHESRTCENDGCSISDCDLRHPRKCRYFLEFHYCKFGTFCKFSHKIEENRASKKEIDTLKNEIEKLENKIQLMNKEIEKKAMEIKKIEEEFEAEKKEKDAKIEFYRNEWHVTQMLFDQFKEDMEYKYGYDSNAVSSEDEVENDQDMTDNTLCSICDFKAKTTGGLKTHITKKHRLEVK